LPTELSAIGIDLLYFCFNVFAFGDVADVALNHFPETDVINVAYKLHFNAASGFAVKRNIVISDVASLL
jgi:hypothetical protein